MDDFESTDLDYKGEDLNQDLKLLTEGLGSYLNPEVKKPEFSKKTKDIYSDMNSDEDHEAGIMLERVSSQVPDMDSFSKTVKERFDSFGMGNVDFKNTDPNPINLLDAHYILQRIESSVPFGEGFADSFAMKNNTKELFVWAQEVIANNKRIEKKDGRFALISENIERLTRWSKDLVAGSRAKPLSFLSGHPGEIARDMTEGLLNLGSALSIASSPTGYGLIGKFAVGFAKSFVAGAGIDIIFAPNRYERFAKNLRDLNIEPPSKEEYLKQSALMAGLVSAGTFSLKTGLSSNLRTAVAREEKEVRARANTQIADSDVVKYSNVELLGESNTDNALTYAKARTITPMESVSIEAKPLQIEAEVEPLQIEAEAKKPQTEIQETKPVEIDLIEEEEEVETSLSNEIIEEVDETITNFKTETSTEVTAFFKPTIGATEVTTTLESTLQPALQPVAQLEAQPALQIEAEPTLQPVTTPEEIRQKITSGQISQSQKATPLKTFVTPEGEIAIETGGEKGGEPSVIKPAIKHTRKSMRERINKQIKGLQITSGMINPLPANIDYVEAVTLSLQSVDVILSSLNIPFEVLNKESLAELIGNIYNLTLETRKNRDQLEKQKTFDIETAQNLKKSPEVIQKRIERIEKRATKKIQEEESTLDKIAKTEEYLKRLIKAVDSAVDKRGLTVAPQILAKSALVKTKYIRNKIANLNKQYIETLTTDPKKLTISKLKKLEDEILRTGQILGTLPELDPFALEPGDDIKSYLNDLNKILKLSHVLKKLIDSRNKLNVKAQKPPETPIKERVVSAVVEAVTGNSYMDMLSLTPFFNIIPQKGINTFDKNVTDYPLGSEAEVSEVFNTAYMKILKSKPLGTARGTHRDDTAIAHVYNQFLNHGTLEWSNRTLYFNQLLEGLNSNDTGLFNKYKDNKDVHRVLYDAIESKGRAISIPDYLPPELLSILNKIGRNYGKVGETIIWNWNQLGSSMSPLRSGKGYILQSHNTTKMITLDPSRGIRTPEQAKEEWIDFINDKMDWEAIKNNHQVKDVREFLGAAYDNIVSTGDGQITMKPGANLTSQLHSERVLIFKDFDSWQDYQIEYGNDDSIVTVIGNHIRSTAKKQTTVQIFGHSAGILANEIKHHLRQFKPAVSGIMNYLHPDNQLARMRSQIENGFNALFAHSNVSDDPTFTQKFIKSVNEVAIPYMLVNVVKYAFGIEPIQASFKALQMGLVDSKAAFMTETISNISQALKDLGSSAVDELSGLLTPEMANKIFGERFVTVYTDMLAVSDIENALSLKPSEGSKKDVWPLAEKIGKSIAKLGLSEPMLEKGRRKSRILIQRRLHEELTKPWMQVNYIFKLRVLEPAGIGEFEWNLMRDNFDLGIVTYNLQPQETALRNRMFSPLAVFNNLHDLPQTPETKALKNIAKRFEWACITYINHARMQGDSLISEMVSPKQKETPGANPAAVIVTESKKALDLFRSWTRTFESHHFYGKYSSFSDYMKVLGVMAAMGVATAIAISYVRGEDPLKNAQAFMRAIFKGITMAAGYNNIANVVETTLRDIDKDGEVDLTKMVKSGLRGTIETGTSPAIQSTVGLGLKLTDLFSHLYQGETAKAMHDFRKLTPFRNNVGLDVIINRIFLDNLFSVINSTEAQREFEIEMKDASNQYRALSVLPGDLTADKFEEHTRKALKHKYGMD